MEKDLQQLNERMSKTFGDRLVSVILYGSAAAGEYNGDFSDLNILCVLRQVGIAELRDAEPVFQWWRRLGNPSPLLLSEEEVKTSTDCFPIEFHDMKERRRVLAGADVIEPITIDESFYRAQLEHELRAKLLRLRQKAGGVMADNEVLLRIMVESVSTFVLLFRHSLRMCGENAPQSRVEVIAEASRVFGFDAASFETLIAVREKRQTAKSLNPAPLLESYLAGIGKVVDVVDRLAK